MKHKQIIKEANELLEFAKEIRSVVLDPQSEKTQCVVENKTINTYEVPEELKDKKFSSMFVFNNIEATVDNQKPKEMKISIVSMFVAPGTTLPEESTLIIYISNSCKIPYKVDKVTVLESPSRDAEAREIETNSNEQVNRIKYFQKIKPYKLFIKATSENTYRVFDDKLQKEGPSYNFVFQSEADILEDVIEQCRRIKSFLKSYLPTRNKSL